MQEWLGWIKSAPGGRDAWRACECLLVGSQLSGALLLEIKLADDGILGNCLTNQFAESNATAMADAREMHRVVVAEEVTLNVADGVQALDDLVIFGKNLGLSVDMQTERDSQQTANILCGVEWGALNGREEIGGNAEVDVFAACGKFVITLDGCLEIVGGNIDFFGELLDGVCFDERSFLLPIGHDVFYAVHEAVVTGCLLLLHIDGVIGVEERPCNVARGVHAGIGQHGLEGHLCAIALAFGIDGKPAHDERGQIQRKGIGGELMNHRSCGAFLQCRSCPAAHEDAVAGIAAFGGVGVGVGAIGDGGEHVDHLLVAADVACCHNDRLCAVVLDVFTVFGGGDNARDATLRIAYQLFGMRVENEFGTVFGGLCAAA